MYLNVLKQSAIQFVTGVDVHFVTSVDDDFITNVDFYDYAMFSVCK